MSHVEILESRIAPATLVNPSTITFQDVDGDDVTLKLSKPLLDSETTANALLTFDAGTVNASNATGQQLQLLNLTALTTPASADGLSISISAKRSTTTGGDGFVNVGRINATGIDLGKVKIVGDLGQIDAGPSAFGKVAIGTLDVQSLGEFGASTQAGGGDLVSTLDGGLGKLVVKSNVREAFLDVNEGGIGGVTVGGTIFGGATANTGRIEGDTIGSVKVKGSLVGGVGPGSASIVSAGALGAVEVLGSVKGGDGIESGRIAGASIAGVKIGRDLKGGVGDESGIIDGGLSVGAVLIGGSMLGGVGKESGSIVAEQLGGAIKSVKVIRDVQGGVGEESAYIHADNFLGPVFIGGSLIGGDGDTSAAIYAGNAISLQSNMAGVTINGDLRGGDGLSAGTIGNANGGLGSPLAVDIGKIVIKGSLIGGGDVNAASIDANDIGSIFIGGSLVGSGSDDTASINTTGLLKSLTIGGSLVGGGGGGSGAAIASALGAAKITGDLQGGGGDQSGTLVANNGFSPPGTGPVKSISILGSMLSGSGPVSGSVLVAGTLGSLSIGGSVEGTAARPVFITASGVGDPKAPPAIGKLAIKGSATFLNVLAGYSDPAGAALNGDSGIGSVSIGGDLIASNIVAGGATAGVDGKFGTLDDQRGPNAAATERVAAIASITVKGQLRGTVGGTDHFGFVAEFIGSVKIGAVKIPLLAGAGNDNVNSPSTALLQLGSTGDFRVHELQLTI